MRVSDFHVGKIMVCGLCFFLFSALYSSEDKSGLLQTRISSAFNILGTDRIFVLSETAAFVLHDFSNNNCATPFFPG